MGAPRRAANQRYVRFGGGGGGVGRGGGSPPFRVSPPGGTFGSFGASVIEFLPLRQRRLAR